MKTTYRFIIAALAAAVALSSCTKDIAADRQDTGLQDGVRTIAVSFAAQTKTTLDGLQPRFNDGDVIKVSNGSECKDITIQVDPQTNNAFFTTTLTGALKAVYPATAAALEGNNITGVKVPAIQNGKFKEANICMANIDANATSATFHNKTAILRFYVDQSVDVRVLMLRSINNPISTETVNVPQTKAKDIDTEKKLIYVMAEGQGGLEEAQSKDNEDLIPLWQGTDDPNKRICYVAVLPISGDNIILFSIALTQEQNEQNQVTKRYSNVTLKEGDIANVFIPYYINVRVGGTADAPKYQRWSYCNLGSFLPEEAGYYYSWGNRVGHWRNGVSDGYVFSEENYDDETFGLGGTIQHDLTSRDDAAYAAWANGEENTWRMPTKGEFETLLAAKPSVTDEGLVFAEGLKFPFAGRIEGSNLMLEFDGKKAMSYWSSIINDSGSAWSMVAAYDPDPDTEIPPVSGLQPSGRHIGMPIRPIYGAPAEEDTGLEIDPLKEHDTLY